MLFIAGLVLEFFSNLLELHREAVLSTSKSDCDCYPGMQTSGLNHSIVGSGTFEPVNVSAL